MGVSGPKILSGLAGLMLIATSAGASPGGHHESRKNSSILPANAHPARVATRVTVRPAASVAAHPYPAPAPPVFYPPRPSFQGPRVHHGAPPPPRPLPAVRQTTPATSAPRWINTEYDDDDAPPVRRWRSHREPDRDDYPARICDEDADDCRPVARLRCDRDGDDCEYFEPKHDRRHEDVAAAYNRGRPDLLSERDRLIAQLDYAQAQFHAARAAGNRRLSARWATYIKHLNHSLADIDRRAAAGLTYNLPPCAVPPPPPASQYLYNAYPATYPAATYPGGVNGYGSNPVGDVMSSLLGPMLSQVP